MGNRAEEDYNFVFKGEWGSPKGNLGETPGGTGCPEAPPGFLSVLLRPPQGSSLGWEG